MAATLKIDPEQFRVRQGEVVDLVRRPTDAAPLCKSDGHCTERLRKHVEHPGDSPWYVVPAVDKNNLRLIVSQIELETFEAMKLAWPKASPARLREMKATRGELTP